MCAQVLSPELGKDIDSNSNQLYSFEEYATLWLWAYPELLDWGHQIKWLFSPVTGKDKYPGDLWGIDNEGNLILVETKLAKVKTKQDPFIDFVNFEIKTSIPTKADLANRFKKLLTDEKRFLSETTLSLSNGILQSSFYPGIVPYSSKRFAVGKWPHLYLNVIAPQFIDEKLYLQTIEALISKFPEKKEFIQYFGLIFLNNKSADGLSNAGKNNYFRLCEAAGTSRVHLVTLRAEYIPPDNVLLESHRR